MIELAAVSDIGLVRANNEDAWDALPESGLFVLADGMGGHRAGEVAARHAVATVCRLIEQRLQQMAQDLIPPTLAGAIEDVNRELFAMGWEDPQLRGMGTTLCVLHWKDGIASWAHVGDSRIYFWDGDHLLPLTQDHTVAAELQEAGLTEQDLEEMGISRALLTRAVGTAMNVEVETGQMVTPAGCFILCSDGLLEGLSEEDLAQALRAHGVAGCTIAPHLDPRAGGGRLTQAAQALVSRAKANRSHDNITVLLIESEGQSRDLSRF
jgi:serine/threonine protein phosphatase PrpC